MSSDSALALENTIHQAQVSTLVNQATLHCMYTSFDSFLRLIWYLEPSLWILSEIYEQAQELVSRIKLSEDVNFEEDWKLVTLFIGGNDLCHSCKYPVSMKIFRTNFESILTYWFVSQQSYTANNYIYNLRTTLDYLKWNMPRTLVNLVVSLDVTGVSYFESTGFFCKKFK